MLIYINFTDKEVLNEDQASLKILASQKLYTNNNYYFNEFIKYKYPELSLYKMLKTSYNVDVGLNELIKEFENYCYTLASKKFYEQYKMFDTQNLGKISEANDD